jgi:hypothetical protein
MAELMSIMTRTDCYFLLMRAVNVLDILTEHGNVKLSMKKFV